MQPAAFSALFAKLLGEYVKSPSKLAAITARLEALARNTVPLARVG